MFKKFFPFIFIQIFTFFIRSFKEENSAKKSKISLKENLIQDSNKKPTKLEETPLLSIMKKKSTFTPPDLDQEISIDTINTNLNVNTDNNKLKKNKNINESVQVIEEKKSQILPNKITPPIVLY